jgi:hypothetical protein
MAAVDGGKMVDERAIEVEEDGAETHAGNNVQQPHTHWHGKSVWRTGP